MAKYTRTELSKHVGLSRASITVAIKNGQLIIEDDLIDDKSPAQNILQIQKWLDKKKILDSNPYKKQKGRPRASTKKKKIEIQVSDHEPESNSNSKKGKIKSIEDSWEFRKLKADTLEREEKAKLAALRVAKERGNNMPIDLVESLIKLVAHHLQNQYKIATENILTEISHKTKMSKENTAKFKGKIIEKINSAHRTGLDSAKKEIKNHVIEVKTFDDESE